MKKEEWFCDMKECNNTTERIGFNLQVIFTTEQTEGMPCEPHLSNATIDLCDDCMKVILSGKYIWADGAQGHNNYYFKNK